MLVETFVLNRHESVREILGIHSDLLICLVDTIGISVTERFKNISALIGNIACISFGKDVICRYSWCVVYNIFRKDSSADDTYDSQKEYADDQSLKETDSDTFLLPLPLGRDILLSPGKIISSVIHE